MTLVLILIAILLVLGLLLFLLCAFIVNQLVMRETLPLPKFIEKLLTGAGNPDHYQTDREKAEKNFDSISSETIEMKTRDGEFLSAILFKPILPNGKTIIACHGARSSGRGEFCFFAPDFLDKGYTILMPDHRGCGQSGGDHMGYGTHESRDLMLWIQFARKNFPYDTIYLLGVSMGAATVLMLSDKGNVLPIAGIIADCSYTSAWDEFAYQLKASFHLPPFPLLPLCDLINRRKNGYSFKEASPISHVRHANIPILFLHGERDDFVPVYMQELLFDACASEKYRLTIPEAVHARSYYTNPELYTKAVEAFIRQTTRFSTEKKNISEEVYD